MSEKFGLGHADSAPPYEDSTTPPALGGNQYRPRQCFKSQLVEIRTRRIQNLLTTHIEPELYSHLLDGIHKRAFLVIPSDILTQQPHLAAKDIVSLPNAGDVTVIRLSGDDNRAAFWQQPGMLRELASSLRARLAASGHKVESDPTNAQIETAERSPSPTLDQAQQRTSPSWLKKQFGTPGPQHDPTATTNYKLGWRAEDEDLPSRTLGLDEMRVLARVRDLYFRVETEMGLLDSVTAKVLWLELEVGT